MSLVTILNIIKIIVFASAMIAQLLIYAVVTIGCLIMSIRFLKAKESKYNKITSALFFLVFAVLTTTIIMYFFKQ